MSRRSLRAKGVDAGSVWVASISGRAGVSLEQGDGDHHRAPALGRGLSVRLKIWRAIGGAAEGASPAGGALDRDMASLYRNEAPRLRRKLARRLNPDKAADVVQSAFVRLLRLGGDRISALDQPQAYLGRIADNLANDDAKFAVRRSEHAHVSIYDHDVATADPHLALEARDMLRRIETAIGLLPDRTREIFMAHRFEDMTYAEIASRMGLSVKTVEKHMSLSLRELHRSLGLSA